MKFLFYLWFGEENLKNYNLVFPNFNVALQTKSSRKQSQQNVKHMYY